MKSILLLFLTGHAASFLIHHPTHPVLAFRSIPRLYLSEDEVSKGDAASETPTPPAGTLEPQPVSRSREITTSYPIPLPSPLLLATTMFLSIATAGSIFELIGSEPPSLGFATTLGIVVAGLPVTVFLFYASIKKAQAETEEDDKRFAGKL